MLDNVPLELRRLPQWVVWRYENVGDNPKPTKVPYCPKSGKHADVNRPDTWGTFEQAKLTLDSSNSYYAGTGFVFTPNDPYCFIDLDDTKGDAHAMARHIQIHNEFGSYSERSPGGMGLHVIIKGSVPAGRKNTKAAIEIYSAQRYATMTGNAYPQPGVPIVEQQSLLMQLWQQMESKPTTIPFKGRDGERYSDAEIMQMAANAINGDKFTKLFNGQWQDFYGSQSEADFALVDIIAFYSEYGPQIIRMFHASQLGKRDKAQRKDYVLGMVRSSFDRMLPSSDVDGFADQIQQSLAAITQPQIQYQPDMFSSAPIVVAAPLNTSVGSLPPGLLGEIAQFVYMAAPRQVPEMALAAAIGLMAGICGRSYNISAQGLNQYVVLIANTGMGKEAMASGIEKLMASIRQLVPASTAFIGPSEIASGQALIKYIDKTPCFVSMLGEFGLRLQELSSQHATPVQKMLRRMIMDLYHKSGATGTLRPSIYSDKANNTDVVYAPSFSILGETTPENFYAGIDEAMIAEGLLPRFTLIEYLGGRPSFNHAHADATPNFVLVDKLASLASYCLQLMQSGRVINVQMDNDAAKLMADLDKYADDKINNANRDAIRSLWNRAHIKALKIASIIAVGVNYLNPVMTRDHAEWAINTVEHDIKTLLMRFESGAIGTTSSENKQTDEVRRMAREFVTRPYQELISYYKFPQQFHSDRIVPYAYLSRRLLAMSAFRLDRAGATNALKRAIQLLIDSDQLREVGKNDMATRYATTQRAFVISDTSILN